MAEEDDASKTEEPTEKKLADSRNKGSVAQSQEIKSMGILLAGTGGLIFLAPFMATSVSNLGRRFIEQPDAIPFDFYQVREVFIETALDMLILTTPFMILMVVAAIAVNIGQVGFLIAGEKIKPDWSKASPLKGIKRMFSSRTLVEFLKGIAKLLIVSLVSFGLAMPLLGDLEVLSQIDLLLTLDRIHLIAIAFATGTVAVMAALAALDFIYQKQTFMKQMRMTKQEVKDEQKQSDGDPQVKARIRKVRMERHQQRMIQAVPDSDVVITNPTHFAVALEYKMGEMEAPKCVAKGVDHLAFRIREVAEEADVPIVENPPLARALYDTVEIDQEIPSEHFTAVAEIIGYVMRQRGDLPMH
ncbi:MAG: flagellar biosynthesis protein FlhB [Rhodospirillaceae bacterium TMED8]|nr:flagellar biosynthesis protein FlhB [Magnetovibrio sp.]OUT50154.1 MAG: flagellar biosynthesis protein FlhB [Rhodospirillaceae bacterium TMED8]|tara:strand:+ start:1107 stop:2180 length:1074 start_codon:yes stop_codon:yes gene_type:complete